MSTPLITAMLASMPPYICRCGREMGGKWDTVDGRWTEVEPGCQPGRCLRLPEPAERDAIRVPESEHRDGVQLGPVQCMAGDVALYDCPCGCKLWTSEPAKLCGRCEQLKPATHWDALVDTCGDCAAEAYSE